MDQDTPAAYPLSGVRVIDVTRNLAGPYCTMMLADMGAEVIKVEPPGGEELRRLHRFEGQDPDTESHFGMYNRNKRSLTLDLKSPRGKEILRALVGKSDVLVQNFAPGALERLGFGWDAVHALNPRLVYVDISGFGPGSSRPAYDGIVQAASGMMEMTGYPDGRPAIVGTSIADVQTGMFAAYGALSALMLAMRTGRGTRVDVAMMDALLATQSGTAAEYLGSGKGGSRQGAESPNRVPHNIYETAEGRFVFVVGTNDNWADLCRVLGLDAAADDPRFRTNQDRVSNRDAVNELLAGRIGRMPLAEVCRLLEERRIPCAPVATFAEVVESDYAREREMVVTIDGALRDGRVPIRVMGRPYKLSDGPPTVRLGPPRLGEANDYVIKELLGLRDVDDGRG